MVEVDFYEEVADELLEFAVIIARTNGKWVFCKHKERDTYEVPGGHRELGESILDAAKRELYEETGAIDYDLRAICVYSVTDNVKEAPNLAKKKYGMLYYAEIRSYEAELHSEIEKILITDELVDNWTYPLIQPKLLDEARRRGYL